MGTATEVSRGALQHPDVQSLDEVNRDVLKALGRPGRGWWALLAVAIAGMGVLFGSWFIQVVRGIGVTGLMSPVGWGVYITSFVFWVGIAHSGTLISAILFLFRAPWRQSIYRAAEAIVFGNIRDPRSRVAQSVQSERVYRVLDEMINTQPAVSYLKKVTFHDVESGEH